MFVIEDADDIVHSPVLDEDFQSGNKFAVYRKIDARVNSDELSESISVDEPLDEEFISYIKGYDKIYEVDFEKVKPWMITVGQMDEDDAIEVFIGCYYETIFYKKADTRPYFFEYKGGKLIKQWTGSYLNSLAFHSAELVDADDDGFDELRVYERVIEDGKYLDRVNFYGIRGFYPYLKVPNVSGEHSSRYSVNTE